MVSLKDVERNTLPTSSYRFEYLLSTCKVEQQTLLSEEEDDDDHYHVRDGITNVVEHPCTCKNDEPKPVLKIMIVEEEKEMKRNSSDEGICLKKLRMLGKVTTKPRTDGKVSGVSSSSSEGGEAAARPELNPSPNGKRKRSRNEGAAAAEMTNSSKRKGCGGGNNIVQEPPPPGLPAKIKNLFLHLPKNREVSEAKLVIQKQLTDTDVSNTHNRLSIPMKHLQETFLTEEEELQLRTRNGKNVGSMDVPLITPTMEMAKVSLRRWEMNKQSGPPSISYVLTNTWNKIKEHNRLKSGMIVQLWAIRIDGVLCLALTSIV